MIYVPMWLDSKFPESIIYYIFSSNYLAAVPWFNLLNICRQCF